MESDYNFSGTKVGGFLKGKHANCSQQTLLKNCFIHDICYIFTGNVCHTVNW